MDTDFRRECGFFGIMFPSRTCAIRCLNAEWLRDKQSLMAQRRAGAFAPQAFLGPDIRATPLLLRRPRRRVYRKPGLLGR